MDTINRNLFETELLDLLDESFDNVRGVYLNDHTSLFETLAGIDASTASSRLTDGGSTIAAQVEHMRWYIEITEGFLEGKQYKGFDWKVTWQVREVSDDEWSALVASLRSGCNRILELIRGFDDWDAKRIGAMMGVLAHTAYHLGAIRQMLTVVKA